MENEKNSALGQLKNLLSQAKQLADENGLDLSNEISKLMGEEEKAPEVEIEISQEKESSEEPSEEMASEEMPDMDEEKAAKKQAISAILKKKLMG